MAWTGLLEEQTLRLLRSQRAPASMRTLGPVRSSQATAGSSGVAPDTRDPSLQQAEHASPGADGDPSVSQWSGEQLHNCRFQGSNGFGDRWPSLVCSEKWRMGTKSSVRWHGSPGSVVWKSGQLHNRQTEEALKRGY